MTEEQTLTIMATLCALYGQGKGDPEIMAAAWYEILKEYDFETVKLAVYRFAKYDNRDYATFPAPGKIVAETEAILNHRSKVIDEAYRQIGYGRPYCELSDDAKAIVPEAIYNEWLAYDPMDLACNPTKYKPRFVEMVTPAAQKLLQ